MSSKAARLFHLLVAVVVTLAGSGAASVFSAPAPAATQSSGSAAIVIQAAGQGSPSLGLQDGVALPADYAGDAALIQGLLAGQARPLALATGDFDEDGVPDLVAGYVQAGRGFLTLHRGNVDSIYPHSPAAQARRAEGTLADAAFLSPAHVFELQAAPGWLGAGDFDNDGHLDLVAAARGDAALVLLPGDGQGGFRPAETIRLPGAAGPGGVTALLAGEINRRDGLADLVVGIAGPDGPRLLIFEGPEGALKAEPETLPLPAEAAGLALGSLDADYPMDLAVAAGNELLVIHGRDRRLSLDVSQQADVPPAAVDTFSLPYPIAALAAANLALDQDGYRLELALLSADGAVHIVDPATGMEVAQPSGLPVSLPGGLGLQLVPANVSSLPAVDLLAVDPVGRQIHILPGCAAALPVALDVAGEPAAVLPMRLNADALDDLVLLVAGAGAPAVVLTAPQATFTVVETGDQGDECAAGDGVCAATEEQGGLKACTVVAGCTLRAALDEANATSAADTILFSLPGTTIQLTDALYAGRPVTIDGTSQPGYAGSPVVELTGSPDVGLYAAGGDTVIRGLAFTGAAQHGLQVDNFYGWNGGNTIVEGNYFGIKPGGTQCQGNSGAGVIILQVADNRVGGTTDAARNVISCNSAHGIQISDGAATLNRVIGNYIGADAAGTAAKGNTGSGVAISDGPNNDVGGSATGERNVIADNKNGAGSGVIIGYANAAGNLVAGNYIGVDKDGDVLPNASDGVALVSDAHHNTIGGTAGTTPSGSCTGSCNLISDNGRNGVHLGVSTALDAPERPLAQGRAAPALLLPGSEQSQAGIQAGPSGNLVQGNRIGTTADGSQAMGNTGDGVHLEEAPGNTIGGGVAAARNVIGGNKRDGVSIGGAGATGNTVDGSYIGADASGEATVPNTLNGVRIDGASDNTIKGSLISGNKENGVLITGGGASGNTVQDNVIGVNAGADKKLGNTHDGVRLDGAPGNTVKDNIIGGNGKNNISLPDAGVKITGGDATGNQVQGNSIGVDTLGTIDLGNEGHGVLIDGAPGNTIGGALAAEGNLISSNGFHGINVEGQGATFNTLKQNSVGTDRSGTIAMPNLYGIDITGAQGTVVEDNLISGNRSNGISIGANAANTQVRGNSIGTNLIGAGKLPNDVYGVWVTGGATYTTLEDNLIAGNKSHGVLVDCDASWTTLRGNRIGTNAAGTVKMPNMASGVVIAGAPHTVIGDVGHSAPPSTCSGGCNLISGNDEVGIQAVNSGDIKIVGNFIGTTLQGNVGLGNTRHGVVIDGGTVEANVIADNKTGLKVHPSVPTAINGNYVGTGADGVTALGNKEWGMDLGRSPSLIAHGNRIWHNPIGVKTEGATILHNSIQKSQSGSADGIECNNAMIIGNQIEGNSTGISLDYGGSCQAHRNNIEDNTFGAHVTAGELDATYNYWNAADGPGGVGPGSGDSVTAGVIYEPWLTSPVAVEVSPGSGVVYGSPGGAPAEAQQVASGWIYIQNWTHPTDTLHIAVEDSLGWLVSPASFTVPITSGLGGSALVSFTIPAGTPIGTASRVTVTATSQADPADTDLDNFQVLAALPVDLALSKTSDVDEAALGQQIHYTLRITNTGPNPAGSAVVTDVLPAEVAFVSAVPSQGTCAELTGTVTCELGGLAVDAQATVDLAVTLVMTSADGEVVNGAWVMVTGENEYDPDLDNNGDSAVVQVLTGTRAYLPLILRNWPPPAWHSQAVDAPHYVDAERSTHRSVAVDAAEHPHAAYGGDNLYHAWHDGTAWHVEVVDAGRRSGMWASLALDSAGHPHIAYHQYETVGCLKYAHFDGTAWSIETVDCEGDNTGAYITLALDGADRPHIAYYSYALDSLKAARWDGTQWHIETVEAGVYGVTNMVGVHNSIAVDGASLPHITYSVAEWGADYLLKHAAWDGTQWQIELVVEGECCMGNSLAAGADGLHLVYETQSGTSTSVLRYTRYTGGAWQAAETVVSSAYTPYGPSLALDTANRPHISYALSAGASGMGLHHAYWDGSAWQFQVAAGGLPLVEFTSLALDGSGRPHILYPIEDLGLLRCVRWDGSAWQIDTVDQGGDPGRGSSLVLDGAGRPHIGYIDYQTGWLKYAAWDGAAWQIQAADQADSIFTTSKTSLALDPITGYPRLAYGSPAAMPNPTGLLYAAWNGAAWQIQTVDSGDAASLVLDALGRPHIAYRADGALRYARWNGTQWVIQTVAGSGAGWSIQLRLDSAGRPHIAYEAGSLDVHYAYWNGTSWQVQTVASAGDMWSVSLALDIADRPHVTYFDQTNGDLIYARWDGAAWQFAAVDSDGRVGIYSSIALDSAGQPHISYSDDTNDTLKYARWDGIAWQIETVETGNVGWYTSLVLDQYDRPHISHYDYNLMDLRYTWFGP